MAAMLHPSREVLDAIATFSQIGAHVGMGTEALAGLMATLEATDADDPVFIASVALKDFELDIREWSWAIMVDGEAVVKGPRAVHRGQAAVFSPRLLLASGYGHER